MGQAVQLAYLFGAEELGFVNQQASQCTAGQRQQVRVHKIGVKAKGGRVANQAEARTDPATADAVVVGCGEQQHPKSSLFVVVRHLQQGSGFASVHRGIAEIELAHALRRAERPAMSAVRGTLREG